MFIYYLPHAIYYWFKMARNMDYLDQCLLKFNKYMNNLGNLTEIEIMLKKSWNKVSDLTFLAASWCCLCFSPKEQDWAGLLCLWRCREGKITQTGNQINKGSFLCVLGIVQCSWTWYAIFMLNKDFIFNYVFKKKVKFPIKDATSILFIFRIQISIDAKLKPCSPRRSQYCNTHLLRLFQWDTGKH